MIGRFLSGVCVGALVGSGLLAVVSVVLPPPPAVRDAGGAESRVDSAGKPSVAGEAPAVEAPVAPVEAVTPEVGPKAEAEPESQPSKPEAAAEPAESLAVSDEAAPEAAPAEEAAAEDVAGTADTAPEAAPLVLPEAPLALAPKGEAEAGPHAPAAADLPLIGLLPSVPPALKGDAVPGPNETPAEAPGIAAAPAPDAPSLPEPGEGEPAAPEALAETAPALDSPAPPAVPEAEPAPTTAENPGLPPLTPEEQALLEQIAKEGPGSALPQIVDQPDAAEVPGGDAAPTSTLPSTPALSDAGEGVTTGRLPRIGDEPAEITEPTEPAAEPKPIAAYAAEFDNPSGKPVFAIVLIDEGKGETDRAALAALPFPVSFALDPSDPKTPEYAALYRAAGREVIMLASALPKGGQASDIEVAMSAMSDALPEAVAVMDLPGRVFQSDRPLASMVVPVVGASGRGLLTWDQGLNAADQVARREDIPASVVFRDLDGEGESVPVMRRYLDRAAFKASQEGRVTVVGRTRPETVAALLEWALEGRAATVALAPLTAVLKVD